MNNFREWLKSNQGIGFILSLVFIFLLISLLLSPWAFRKLSDGFYLGFLPIVSTVLLLLFSAILAFDNRRKEIPADLRTFGFKSILTAVLILGGCWFYFWGMKEIGFLTMTPFCLFLAFYIFGLKPWWKCIIIAVVVTVVVYTLFGLLGLKMPLGILSEVLPF